MSRVLHELNPYDVSISERFPNHDHPLYPTADHGQCAGCSEGKEASAEFLECPECDIFFHKECIESLPQIINHPFHPQHALYLVERKSLSDTNPDRKCCLCGQDLMLLVYRCLICDFKLDLSCAKKPPLLEVDQPQMDQYKLQLLMKNVSFTCDSCGLKGDRSPYICLPYNSMFHIRCVNYPEKSFHHYFDIPGIWYCGCGSSHSNVIACGKIREAIELAERQDEYYISSPRIVIDEVTIQHFTHTQHFLSFIIDGQVDDVNKRCDMCKLPVASIPHYGCTECDFYLHKRCTKLPRRKTSMLHNHPLNLEPGRYGSRMDVHEKYYCCSACGQLNDGAKYTCDPGFNLDVGCASITFPFNSPIHQHPLTFKSNGKQKCEVCKLWASPVLSCEPCGFYLGFDCAQLPVKARHKYDDHPLILDISKNVDRGGDYWCEICEKKVDKSAIFYTCDESSCCSTFHTHCVAGGLNLELGLRFTLFGHEFVVEDNALTAPRYCCICGLGCKGPKVIKSNQGGDKYLCSSSCLMRNRRLLHDL